MDVPMMKADDEPETDELSVLGQQYRAALPHILVMANSDLGAALAAFDRFLDQSPPRGLRKAFLTWKGRLYLEHGRYDDAARELRAADALQVQDDLKNFNTKLDLAKALEGGGDPGGACAVLATALDEIQEPSLLLDLLPPLVRLTTIPGRAMPPRAEAALSRAKQFYGLDHASGADVAAEAVRVAKLVHDASVRFDQLHSALRRAENPAEKLRRVEEYLDGVSIPRFKQQAEDLLHRMRGGTGHEM